jgi:hypothetical protein
MPIVVLLAAGLQGVAAGMNGLAVWRTVGMVDGSRVVPLVAAVAVYVCAREIRFGMVLALTCSRVFCSVAGIYNVLVANEMRNELQIMINGKPPRGRSTYADCDQAATGTDSVCRFETTASQGPRHGRIITGVRRHFGQSPQPLNFRKAMAARTCPLRLLTRQYASDWDDSLVDHAMRFRRQTAHPKPSQGNAKQQVELGYRKLHGIHCVLVEDRLLAT